MNEIDEKPAISLKALIDEVEAAHFRTQQDSGAHPNAMLVWNSLRRLAGLPRLERNDLRAYCAVHRKYHRIDKDYGCLVEVRKPPGQVTATEAAETAWKQVAVMSTESEDVYKVGFVAGVDWAAKLTTTGLNVTNFSAVDNTNANVVLVAQDGSGRKYCHRGTEATSDWVYNATQLAAFVSGEDAKEMSELQALKDRFSSTSDKLTENEIARMRLLASRYSA